MKNTTTTAKRKATPGSFKPGPDSRRHRFTREECSRGGVIGFWAALEAVTVRYNDDRARTFGKYLRREGRFA